jgi:hypothetical protein
VPMILKTREGSYKPSVRSVCWVGATKVGESSLLRLPFQMVSTSAYPLLQ